MMVRSETIKMLIRARLQLKRWIEALAVRNVLPLGDETIRILRAWAFIVGSHSRWRA